MGNPRFESPAAHVLSLIMVEIFLAPAGARGVTKKMLEEALRGGQYKNDFSGIVYLAPASQKRKEAQRSFHETVSLEARKGGYIPPIMLTPGQLAKKIIREQAQNRLLLSSWLKVPLIMKLSGKSMGHAATLSGFMGEMKGHFPGKKAGGILDAITPLIDELAIAEEIGIRLEETMGTISLYEQRLAENGFIDPDSSVAEAANMLRDNLKDKTGFQQISVLVLDGFHDISPSEKALIAALIEISGKTLASVPVNEKYPGLSDDYLGFIKGFSPHREVLMPGSGRPMSFCYYAYDSREQEVEAAARRIKINYISGTFTDLSKTAVILPNPSGYTDMIERVFVKYGVPCSFPAGSGNSAKARREKDLLAVIKTVICDYGAPELSRLLSSPFFKDIPEELCKWAPHLTISSVSGGFENWLKMQGAPVHGLKWLEKKLGPLQKAVKETAAGTSRMLISGFLEALKGLDFSAGDLFDGELEDRLNGFSLLDILAGAGLTPEEFMDAVSLAASGIDEEKEEPGVRVLGFHESQGIEPESLYFLGLKDGDIPGRPETDFFLPERLRAKLGLRTMKKTLLIEEFLFGRIASSAGFVHLSYPDMEEDKLFLPSILISEGQPEKDPAYGVFSKEEELVRKGRAPYSAYINEIENIKDKVFFGTDGQKSEKLKKSKKAINVTDIDAFRTCPRFFFLDKVLGLAPPEAGEFGLDAKIVGTLLHRIMERLLPFPEEDAGINAFENRADKIIDSVLTENPVHPYWGRLLKESFLAALPGFHEIEKKFSLEGFNMKMAERRVEGELKGIRLKGKIDRVDENEETGAHRIIDYKSGAVSLNSSDVLKKGASLQLFLYAALADEMGIEKIRNAGIYSFKDMKVKLVPGKRDASSGNTMDVFVEAALGWLEETVRMAREGDFPAAPISEQSCRMCHEKPYCPFINGSDGNGNG